MLLLTVWFSTRIFDFELLQTKQTDNFVSSIILWCLLVNSVTLDLKPNNRMGCKQKVGRMSKMILFRVRIRCGPGTYKTPPADFSSSLASLLFVLLNSLPRSQYSVWYLCFTCPPFLLNGLISFISLFFSLFLLICLTSK